MPTSYGEPSTHLSFVEISDSLVYEILSLPFDMAPSDYEDMGLSVPQGDNI